MSSDMQRIVQSKDAERRRLRELPWLEKLEMLDKLRERHLWLRNTRAAGAPLLNAPASDHDKPGQ